MITYLTIWYFHTKQTDTVSSVHIFEKTGTVHVMGSSKENDQLGISCWCYIPHSQKNQIHKIIVIFKHLHWRSSSLCNDLILEKKSSVNIMLVSAKRTIKFNLEIQTFQSVNKQVASIAQPYLEPDEFSQFRILLKSICETYNNKETIKTVTFHLW